MLLMSRSVRCSRKEKTIIGIKICKKFRRKKTRKKYKLQPRKNTKKDSKQKNKYKLTTKKEREQILKNPSAR